MTTRDFEADIRRVACGWAAGSGTADDLLRDLDVLLIRHGQGRIFRPGADPETAERAKDIRQDLMVMATESGADLALPAGHLALLQVYLGAHRAQAIGDCVRWHEERGREPSGPDYGIAPEDERRELRKVAGWHRCCANALAALAPAGPGSARNDRQKRIVAWGQTTFGIEHMTSVPQRGIRLLEEAIEAYQAAGCDADMAHKLIDFIFERPVGELGQEIGGIGVCLLALANAAGFSADAEEMREVARVLSKPATEFAKRNEEKNAAGFNVTGAYPVAADG